MRPGILRDGRRCRGGLRGPGRSAAAPRCLGLGHRLRRHYRSGRLPQAALPAPEGRGQRGAAVPDAAGQRLSASTASRASATSTYPGSTTCATRRRHGHRRRRLPADLRLFNEPAGRATLAQAGGGSLAGPEPGRHSGIANLLSAIRWPRHFELTGRDVLFTVATDSATSTGRASAELTARRVPTPKRSRPAISTAVSRPAGQRAAELTYADRRRIHNPQVLHVGRAAGPQRRDLALLWHDEELCSASSSCPPPGTP